MTAAPVQWQASSDWLKDTADFAGRHAVPLLALSPAAYISWLHMTGAMGYDPNVSVVIAAALELLGYVTIDTLITALNAKRWDIAIASGASFVGYISIIVSLNTALNIAVLIAPQVLAWAKVAAEAALVMLTVPAALWAASREVMRRSGRNEVATLVIAANEAAQIRAEQIAERAAIRAEKNALKTSVAEVPRNLPKLTETYRNKTERAAVMIPAFIVANGRLPKLSEVETMLTVKTSQASHYLAPYKEAQNATNHAQ